MKFKRCHWCKYCAKLKVYDVYGNYKDSICCLLYLLGDTNSSERTVFETRKTFSCSSFEDAAVAEVKPKKKEGEAK